MKILLTPLVITILLTASFLKAQAVNIPITVTDNAATQNTKTVYVGVDPAATDGIDLALGEGELPPMPPSGNFEARLFLPAFSGSLASYRDYRAGTQFQVGTTEYRLRYQKHSTATNVTVAWVLPENVTGQLKDVATNGVIINVAISGSGSYTVANPTSFNQLKVFITYNLVPTTVTITAIPEGKFNVQTGRLLQRDTCQVYLASSTAPYAYVDSATLVIDSVTFSGDAQFAKVITGNYYVVLKGRNILETWSKTGGIAVTKGETSSYNFTTSQAQAFGSNLKLAGGRWCVFSGDVNQDGVIDFSDLRMTDNNAWSAVSGYVSTDLNGDGIVNYSDLKIVDGNCSNLVTLSRP